MPFGQSLHACKDAASLVVELCASTSSCDEVAMRALETYRSAFEASPRWGCCSQRKVAAQMAASTSALGAARGFLAGCTGWDKIASSKSCWTHHDATHYYNSTWLPTTRLGGGSCRAMTRFGPPFGPRGDGGKTICEAQQLFGRPGCLVVSIGLNGDTRFESAHHAAYSGCEVVGYDHTLSKQKEALLPPFLRYVPRRFNNMTWTEYTDRSVRLLKLDCDGCEYATLPIWVAS